MKTKGLKVEMRAKTKGLKVEMRALEALVPYARNARTHSAAQVAQIAASVREFGWTNPLLVAADGTVIAGHGRLLAARQLEMQEVPCIVLDHLTESQRRALVIADNRLALSAGWDEDMLAVELQQLSNDGFTLTTLGFDADEVSRLLFTASDLQEPVGSTEVDTDAMTMAHRCPKCGFEYENDV
jgi:ParB-like chromosome segregation protein Spo0J